MKAQSGSADTGKGTGTNERRRGLVVGAHVDLEGSLVVAFRVAVMRKCARDHEPRRWHRVAGEGGPCLCVPPKRAITLIRLPHSLAGFAKHRPESSLVKPLGLSAQRLAPVELHLVALT